MRPYLSLVRARSAALVVAAAAVLATVGTAAPARAETPPSRARSDRGAGDRLGDRGDRRGHRVITREVDTDDVREVAEAKEELAEQPGVVNVSVDVPVYPLGTPDPQRPNQWTFGAFNLDALPAGTADGEGIAGLSNAQIMPVRVLGATGGGTSSGAAAGTTTPSTTAPRSST